MIEVSYFFRDGCHLCDAMLHELGDYLERKAFKLDPIEISGNPDHEAAYGDKVPVLAYGDKIICQYYLDRVALNQFLDAAQ